MLCFFEIPSRSPIRFQIESRECARLCLAPLAERKSLWRTVSPPLLANVYWRYALDLGYHKVVKP